MAIATVVTIAAMAGTGSMKNVKGINSAAAIVAVSPGIAPTNKPNNADSSITPSTPGSSTNAKACKNASMTDYPNQRSKSPEGNGTSKILANKSCNNTVVAIAIDSDISSEEPRRYNSMVRI